MRCSALRRARTGPPVAGTCHQGVPGGRFRFVPRQLRDIVMGNVLHLRDKGLKPCTGLTGVVSERITISSGAAPRLPVGSCCE
ncbi:hypothetical protein GCM10009753_37220 [Streptantibioticus ferralitis]